VSVLTLALAARKQHSAALARAAAFAAIKGT
jgi:hypothetical protein